MKTRTLILALLLSTTLGYAQKVTFEDRLTKYFPVLQPRPCSIWMLDWGVSEADVVKEAKRVGLVNPSSNWSDDSTKKIITYQEPDRGIYYSFVIGDAGYSMFICQMSYKTPVDAQARIDELSQDVWLYWDAKTKASRSHTTCDQTGVGVGIMVSRVKQMLTLSIYSTLQ